MGIIPVVLIALIVIAFIIGMIWAMKTGKEKEMSKRSAIWGSLITGFAGWIFAINSMLGGEEIGAGLCLFASAIAFGVIALLAIKQ
jgi:hypothetical protein